MLIEDRIKRNWKVWSMYRTGQYTQKQVGDRFGISGQRVAQISRKIDRKFATALNRPHWPEGRQARAHLHTVALELSVEDQKPETYDPSRPWMWLGKPLRHLWTREPVPGAPKEGGCWFAPANKNTRNPIIMAAPAGYVEPEQPSAAPTSSTIDNTTPIGDLPLSTRTVNTLLNDDYKTLGDIIDFTEEQFNALLAVPNFGKKSLNELREFLHDIRSTQPEASREDLLAALGKAKADHKALEAAYKDLEIKMAAVKRHNTKLRGVLSGFASNMTIGQLREAGVQVDLLVTKD